MAIHRAIYGSLERFIGVLTEHFAGAFPLWCAPVQAVVIPIADRHVAAAEELAGVLERAGCASRSTGPTTGCRTRSGSRRSRRCRYMLVLGDREIEARAATVRRRGAAKDAAQETLGWDELADRLAAESADRRVE